MVRSRGTYLGERRADSRGVEGRSSHEHGVEEAAQAPDVRLQAMRGPRRYFRTKVNINYYSTCYVANSEAENCSLSDPDSLNPDPGFFLNADPVPDPDPGYSRPKIAKKFS